MKKIIQTIKREEVIPIMFVVFIVVTLATSFSVIMAPFQFHTGAVITNKSVLFHALLILTPPGIISLLVGVCVTIWKMKFPSKKLY